MSEFISGDELGRLVEKIVQGAEKEAWLVSPYLNARGALCATLAAAPEVRFTIICAKRPDDLPLLKNLRNIETRLCRDLHAKAYLNEREGVVASMNLLDFPRPRNMEFGVRFDKLLDATLYDDVERAVIDVYCRSDPLELLPGEADSGRCIRCGATIKFDIQRPYCASCFANWYLYRNRGYLEKFCHYCGTRTIFLCINNPLCADCQIKMTRRPA